MQGEIRVMDIMDQGARLREWRAKQARDAEWEALKQWWKAERMVRNAQGEDALRRAVNDRAQTARLYRCELHRAWPKWARAQEELRARRQGKLQGIENNGL